MKPGLAYLLAVALLPACDPGSLYDNPVQLADGGVFVCEPETSPMGTGYHNPGMACLTSGCHANGGGPAFTVAGTVFVNETTATPAPGATVVVVDGDGTRFELVTAQNGNFWTNQPMVFPILVKASQCPHDNPMISLSQTGDCNAGNCHGPTFRVALQSPM